MTAVSEAENLQTLLSEFERQRPNLVPLLQAAQERLGYLSEETIHQVADFLSLSPSDVYGVATFYSQFRFIPPGKRHIKVCQGTACHVRGSGLILEELTLKLGIGSGETTEDREYSLERVACYGSCALAPVVIVDDKVHGRMTPKETSKIVETEQ